MINKGYAMIGMARKAGQAVSGEFTVEKAVKDKSAKLVIVASDASANTKKLFHDKCTYYEVMLREFGTKEELGRCLGQEQRACVAILSEGFASAVDKALEGKGIE